MNLDISIVSHGQSRMLLELLHDAANANVECSRLIITKNIPEEFDCKEFLISDETIIIDNSSRKGFGANHNSAFDNSNANYFAVLNPDLRFNNNPFPMLLENFKDPKVGIVCPLVTDSEGVPDDSTRKFPTLPNLIRKFFKVNDGGVQRATNMQPTEVDWAAGMFLIIKKEAMLSVGGFDSKFFLYYEDVDLCARLRECGWKIVLDPRVSVVHLAQRQSHRNFRYMIWHFCSIVRYFLKHPTSIKVV